MTKNNFERAMEILENERIMEKKCAMLTMELAKRTLNPIKRIRMKRHANTLMDHSIGVMLAISRIKRELGI